MLITFSQNFVLFAFFFNNFLGLSRTMFPTCKMVLQCYFKLIDILDGILVS